MGFNFIGVNDCDKQDDSSSKNNVNQDPYKIESRILRALEVLRNARRYDTNAISDIDIWGGDDVYHVFDASVADMAIQILEGE